MTPTPSQMELWANGIVRDCLLCCGGDVGAGLAAAELILSTQPVPEEKETKPSISAFFAYDIANRHAQGILNRTLKAAKGLTDNARKDLANALKDSATDSGQAILEFIDKYRLQLAKLLTTTQLASLLEGAREVSAKVPVLKEDAEAIGEVEQPTFPKQEGIHLTTIEDAAKQLGEKNVLTRHDFDALDAAARAKAFAVAGVDAEDTLTKIRDVLAKNVKEGADYETFKSQVMEAVDEGTFLSDAHTETVFRTNVQGAFSDGQMAVLQNPLIRSGFPYSAYDSIHDDRVRTEHLSLDKHGIDGSNIYRTDDPVFQTFRPPWDYNCRCSWTPITVRQASEAGVKEAQQWIDSGVEPSPPHFVAMPPFEPPPGFQRALVGAPLSIRLSLQPIAAFSTDSKDSKPKDEKSERIKLIAEILVILFKDNAPNVAKKLLSGKPSDGAAFTVDLEGNKHKGKGSPAGGQFTSNSGEGKTQETQNTKNSLQVSPATLESFDTAKKSWIKHRSNWTFTPQWGHDNVNFAFDGEELVGWIGWTVSASGGLDLSIDTRKDLRGGSTAIRLLRAFLQSPDHSKVKSITANAVSAEGQRMIDTLSKKLGVPWTGEGQRSSGLSITDFENIEGAAFTVDAEGLEHKDKGTPEGGQFTNKGKDSGSSKSKEVPRLKKPSIFGNLRRRAAIWSLRLSRPERKALEEYVDNSEKINKAIRDEPNLDKIQGEVGEQARAIAAALERSPSLNGLEVYRGQQWYDNEPKFLQLAEQAAKVGGAIQFAGFQSSTVDPEVAENFSSGTVLEITTATRGAYLEHNAARRNEQYEVLLPHNSLFHVIEVTEREYPVAGSGGKTKKLKVVRMEQVPRSGEDGYQIENTSLKGVGLATPKSDSSAAFAFNAAGTIWHGPTPPSPTGWVQIAPGPRGGLRWVSSTSVASGAAPAPGTPVVSTPAVGGGTRAIQASTAAHTAAMAKLNTGQPLTAADKASLARKLTNMPVGLLRSLHSALGGTAAVGGKPALVAAVRGILTGASPAPIPTLPIPPTPPVTPPTPAPVATPPPTPANPVSASSIHTTAIAALNAGTPLGPTGLIPLLTQNLPNMSYGQLQTLFTALGGTNNSVLYGNHHTLQANVDYLLNPPAAAPVAPPVPTPVAPPTPSPLHRGANVITGAPATVTTPKAPHNTPDEVWETGTPKPGSLNGIPFTSAPHHFWEKVADVNVKEPPPNPKVTRAGILIQEPDGRVWICAPTNGFGGRKHTLPGGTLESGLSTQQNALKEVWEETGLQVEITGYAGDFNDSNYPSGQPGERFGRLYIGKRVGGAPWDAKVESHIISNKTNKPTAESETVSLVTPERAAQLLHRTDDLAQLMVAHPPPINTPVKGAGSGPLKKLVEAIKPAADDYKRKKDAKGEYHGNAELHVIQDMRGFNKKPKVVTNTDFDALMAKGEHIEMLRGVATSGAITGKQMADQFRNGDNFSGHGIFGSGTYADSNSGYNHNVASSYAAQYYGSGGALMRIALPKTAKVIKVSELEKAVPTSPEAFKAYPRGKQTYECWMGVQAALAGYDAIIADGNSSRHGGYGKGFYVILNRSILTVQDKDPPQGYRIP